MELAVNEKMLHMFKTKQDATAPGQSWNLYETQILLPPKYFALKLIVKNYPDNVVHAGCEYV